MSQSTSADDESSREVVRGQRTLRMTLAYDGTNYCGWQVQPNGTSLQEVMEKGVSQFVGEPIHVTASGRTDAGVHAVGQVVSFRTTSTAPCHGFLQGLPVHLPDDVVIRDVQEVRAGFNARFDAKRKWYRYVIHNTPVRNPFLRNYALWHKHFLDEAAMDAAARHCVGTHDFKCFETKWPNRSSSVRTVFDARITRMSAWPVWYEGSSTNPVIPSTDPPGDFLCFDIEADGFLYNMVRAILGTLLHVGRRRWTPEAMRDLIANGTRSDARETAPAHGLYLMKVDY